mmetsp:Transcript_4403/g.10570  ORF Transcript_4403/g.10570 Transcript_4403/m.10570 type:complete len:274 (-) Transcript_4403:285-1106(-)
MSCLLAENDLCGNGGPRLLPFLCELEFAFEFLYNLFSVLLLDHGDGNRNGIFGLFGFSLGVFHHVRPRVGHVVGNDESTRPGFLCHAGLLHKGEAGTSFHEQNNIVGSLLEMGYPCQSSLRKTSLSGKGRCHDEAGSHFEHVLFGRTKFTQRAIDTFDVLLNAGNVRGRGWNLQRRCRQYLLLGITHGGSRRRNAHCCVCVDGQSRLSKERAVFVQYKAVHFFQSLLAGGTSLVADIRGVQQFCRHLVASIDNVSCQIIQILNLSPQVSQNIT